MSNEKLIFTCAASLLTLIVGYIGYTALTAKKYVLRTKIKKLVIYPIKSLPGVEVDHLDILPSMCKYENILDRSWVLLDDANRMITMRNEPLLAKIKTTLFENEICLEADNMPPIKIQAKPPLKKGDRIHTIDVFGQELDGQDCGKEINGWFERYLGSKNCKLVKHHDAFGYRGSAVVVNGKPVDTQGKDTNIIYHDAAPILMINETSVQDMNKRIQAENVDEKQPEVVWQRFRPNIFFRTDKEFEEDNWKYVKINNSEFEMLSKFFFGWLLFFFDEFEELWKTNGRSTFQSNVDGVK